VGSSHDRQLIAARLDGAIVDYGMRPGFEVGPAGTTALYPVSAFGADCPVADPKNLDGTTMMRGIRDLATNTDFWQVPNDRDMWVSYGSPSGREFLYGEIECPQPDLRELRWRLVSAADPTPQEISDPFAVLRDWYGDDLIWGRCGDIELLPDEFAGSINIPDSGLDEACEEPVELLVGDRSVATVPTGDEQVYAYHVLGLLELPPVAVPTSPPPPPDPPAETNGVSR
jgi:hypothetical protein